MKDKANVTDTQRIAQSERLAKAHRAEEQAIRDVNRALDDHNAKTKNLGDVAQQAAEKIGNLGVSFRGLSVIGAVGMLPAAATAITEVAGALQQLSGAALAGPGIFAGIAASAGVAALGMHGMSDAFTASMKAMDGTKASVDAANKALAQLSPNAADAIKTVVGLKGTFTELRDISSQNLFQGFSEGLKSMTGNLLPTVTRGVDGISKALNQNLLQVMSSLGSSSTQGFLDRILGNTANAQGKLTAAIDPIVHAVGVLTAAGSDTLPRLATAVGNVADRFNQFITTADANGNLAKWIDKGLDGFTQLGNTVLNIGKIFTDLTQAAGGGAGLLGTLESATGKLHDFLSSTEGQSKLRDYFTQGRDMLSQLKDIAVSAGPVLAGMFSAASSAANAWLPEIKDILNTINSIPGGAEAVVAAFVAWQGIKGIASVAGGLKSIVDLLKIALPAAAVEGAAGITTAFGGLFAAGGIFAKMLPFMKFAGAIGIGIGGQQDPVGAKSGYSEQDILKITMEHPELRGPGDIQKWIDAHPKGATGFVPGSSADPNWSPVLDPTAARPGTFRRRDGSIGTLPTPGSAGDPSSLSSYSDPVITSGAGGAAKDPFIDPSKWQGGDPLAGMPAAVAGADPQKVFEADSRLITESNNLAQKKLALQVLEAKGNASQRELFAAKTDLQQQERTLYDAQAKDVEARTNQMKQATSDLNSIFAPLDQDFGISKGIPGLVENLTKMFGNMAMAGAIGSSPTLQTAALALSAPQTGTSGVAGSNAANSAAIGQQFFGTPGGGYPGDAALLANVPAGKYDASGDLAKGLGDCSSSVEDLVNLMDGRPTAGRNMSTSNEADWLTQHGFQPTNQPMPGTFQVGFNPDHTQATLPGGTNFNWGSDAAAAKGGVDGTGAWDPAFTSHYYRPAGATAALPGGGGGFAGAGSGGATPVFVVNMPGGGMGLPGGFPIGSPASGQGAGPAPGPAGANWDAMAQKEASGNWAMNSGNGFSGGLQFTPSTWATNKPAGAPDQAWQASKEQQIAAAENVLKTQGPGAWPSTFTPASGGGSDIFGPANTNPGLNNPAPPLGNPADLFTGGGGQGPIFRKPPPPPSPAGIASASGTASGDLYKGKSYVPPGAEFGTGGIAGLDPTQPFGPMSPQPSTIGPFAVPPAVAAAVPAGVGKPVAPAVSTPAGFNTGQQPAAGTGPGFQIGGAAGAGLDMAGMAADVVAPGSSLAIKLGKRAIEFGAQAAGIGASGLMETFLPAGSPLAGSSWFSKVAGGIAGARPAKPNMAAQGAQPPQQGGQPPGGQPGQGGPGGAPITVNYTNNQATEDRAGADLTNHLSSMNSSPGPGNPRG